MRSRLSRSLVVLGLVALPLAAQEPSPGERLPVVRHVLPNGMTFLFLRREGAPTVSFVTQFRAGGVDEWTGISGTAHPLDVVLDAMADAAEAGAFERAARWLEKFEALEWLFGALARLRAAVEGLSFVYAVEDGSGESDDRVYLVRHGIVRAEAPWPRTPLERQAFAAEIARHAAPEESAPAARTAPEMDQLLLVMSWFRRYPEEYEQTTPYRVWREGGS